MQEDSLKEIWTVDNNAIMLCAKLPIGEGTIWMIGSDVRGDNIVKVNRIINESTSDEDLFHRLNKANLYGTLCDLIDKTRNGFAETVLFGSKYYRIVRTVEER